MSAGPKVVLIDPHKSHDGKPFPPLSLLYLEAALSRSGRYRCEIVDYNVGQEVGPFLRDPSVLGFGITSRTGDSLVSAARIARHIKSERPDRPVIWGGIHVTSVPDESAREPFVDIVVRHEGEDTLEDLLGALSDGRPLETVPGLTFRKNGAVISTGSRRAVDLASLPALNYEGLDLGKYDTNILWLNTSRGCPYRCEFCCNAIHPGYRSAMPSDLVEAHLRRYLLALRPEFVFITDYNFFADKRRVRRLVPRLGQAGSGVRWGGHIVANDAGRLETADLDLLRESGCVHLVSGQDGSAKMMREVRKPCTHAEVDAAIERLSMAGIGCVLNYIIGLPGESPADLMSVVHDIKRRDSRYGQPINLYIFYPWPATPITDRVRALGGELPEGVDGWSGVFLGDAGALRFHSASYRRMVQTAYYVASLAKQRPLYVFEPPAGGRLRTVKAWFLRSLKRAYMASAQARWERECFGWGVEWQLLHTLARARFRGQMRRLQRMGV
jgi:radical SAM superfamily enzyme YgiQ (UPF0313 family)